MTGEKHIASKKSHFVNRFLGAWSLFWENLIGRIGLTLLIVFD